MLRQFEIDNQLRRMMESEYMSEIEYKYSEDEIIQELMDYIDTTYNQHYVGQNNVQTIDMWEALGSADTTARDTALKYLMRFGKKSGKNKKDLLKAMHYIVLLWYYTYGDET